MQHAPSVLVVDLDGTLIRSDMLFESFWSSLSKDWRTPLACSAALGRGRAALKKHLAATCSVDAATLPYNTQVLEFIAAWRRSGGKTALVTATDQGLALGIAMHLGIFDEVHGSNGEENLKGRNKARFLENRFGHKAFAYMGDAEADLPVWQSAAKAITVNASHSLRAKAESVCPAVQHLGGKDATWKHHIKALRPHQWVKNLLILLPMLAAHRADLATLMMSALAILSFSLVASSVYMLNDLLDLAADRLHPRKRNRPFASGRVRIAHGTAMAGMLLVAGILIAAAIHTKFLVILGIYYALTMAYSLDLKRRIVIDICVLAGLYTIRIIAGAMATDIPLSVWLLAFSVFLFLSLAAVKRQAELVDSAARGVLAASGRGYRVSDLPMMPVISIAAGYAAVLVLALYVNSATVMALYPRPEALWGVCAVLLYWITRTVMVAHRGYMHDDPIVYAARDRISQACIMICASFVVSGAIA